MILSMDLGKFSTVCCLYDTQTRKHCFETIATKQAHVDHLLNSNQADLVVMEACRTCGWISDTPLGERGDGQEYLAYEVGLIRRSRSTLRSASVHWRL